MFGYLDGYRRILVTGPQRSGTTICARAIAHDIGYAYIDEDTYRVHDKERFAAIAARPEAVIQCPAMAHIIHEYGQDDTMIIWMVRDLEAILRSQRRIQWEAEDLERRKYRRSPYYHKNRPIAAIKAAHWHHIQRDLIPHWLEIPYRTLMYHPLWVPDKRRGDFETRQWSLSCPV